MGRVDYYQARLNEGFAEIGRVTRKLEKEETMAALQPAVDRIKYIITGEGKRKASPATISGYRARQYCITGIGQGSVQSYQKCIGMEQEDGSWRVNDDRDSLTTNRHVRALMAALDELGIPYTTGPLW